MNEIAETDVVVDTDTENGGKTRTDTHKDRVQILTRRLGLDRQMGADRHLYTGKVVKVLDGKGAGRGTGNGERGTRVAGRGTSVVR